MCNPTSAPPRRDLYELTQTLSTVPTKSAAEKGGFLVPKTKPGRIGTLEWIESRDRIAFAVFNGAYDDNGKPVEINDDPWTVITPEGEWEHFKTHTEALAWALEEARK